MPSFSASRVIGASRRARAGPIAKSDFCCSRSRPRRYTSLVLEQLLTAEIQLRNNPRLQAAMRSSRLPAVKQLRDFDFTFQPSLRREPIDSLHELGFLERRENVIFVGPPGIGKTHLAISVAIAAAQSDRRVYYGTLADPVASLEEAQRRPPAGAPEVC
jgi:DNA replication protein DnaC